MIDFEYEKYHRSKKSKLDVYRSTTNGKKGINGILHVNLLLSCRKDGYKNDNPYP